VAHAEAIDGAHAAVAIPRRTVSLADGRRVIIRSATPADLAGIIDFFERLSATSRSFRFFSPQPRLRRAMIERVVAAGTDRTTVLAQPVEFQATSRHVVAVGGWIEVPAEGRADVSVAVGGAWQNVMLGSALVLVLLQAAVATGRTRFAADVVSGDVRMLGLLGALGAPLRTTHEAGVAQVHFEIPPASREPVPVLGNGARLGSQDSDVPRENRAASEGLCLARKTHCRQA
jgi:hypothetical protein